jgi:hypothetical protein
MAALAADMIHFEICIFGSPYAPVFGGHRKAAKHGEPMQASILPNGD